MYIRSFEIVVYMYIFSVLQPHLNVWDAYNLRFGNCSVTEYHLYNGSWNWNRGLIIYFYSWESLKAGLRVAEHNSYSLEYQSSVETLVHPTRHICCRSKNLTFQCSRPIFIFWIIFNEVRRISTKNKILIHLLSD